jgi:HK97 family phage prohead protease
MLWASPDGQLELRKRGSQGLLQLQGRFPYNSRAVLHSGGNGRRPRKEVFAPRAFRFAIEDEDRDIHFLVGHSVDRPLASRGAGTLSLTDTDEALIFVADISEDLQRAQYVQDFLRMLTAGLIGGISPGFRVAPPEAVENAETVEEEDPAQGNALIRTIFAAVLFELSAVTRPAYDQTQLDQRSWELSRGGVAMPKRPSQWGYR